MEFIVKFNEFFCNIFISVNSFFSNQDVLTFINILVFLFFVFFSIKSFISLLLVLFDFKDGYRYSFDVTVFVLSSIMSVLIFLSIIKNC